MTTLAGSLISTIRTHLRDDGVPQRFTNTQLLLWLDEAVQAYSNVFPLPKLTQIKPHENRAGDFFTLPDDFRSPISVYEGYVPYLQGWPWQSCLLHINHKRPDFSYYNRGRTYDIVFDDRSNEHRAYLITHRQYCEDDWLSIHYLGNHHRINDVGDDIDIPTHHEPIIYAYVKAAAVLSEEFFCAQCESKEECNCEEGTSNTSVIIQGQGLTQISRAARHAREHWSFLLTEAKKHSKPAYINYSSTIETHATTHYDYQSEWF